LVTASIFNVKKQGRIYIGSFSIWHWLIVLLIVVVIFGTKKLKNIVNDVGEAVKNFKDAVEEKTDTDDNSTKKPD